MMNSDEAVIDFSDVLLQRSGNTLVGPVNWVVEEDERWVIIGPNGAGKTSLFSLAAGEEFPTSGKAIILGQERGKNDVRELKQRVGVVSSYLNTRIPDNERVSDLIISAAYSVLGKWRETYDEMDINQSKKLLEVLKIGHLDSRTFGTLSEGEKKRVLLARAMMTDPELLLLDEPAAGLDLGGREELLERLSELALDPESPAMVLITHHVEEIPYGFTHAMLLNSGKIVAAGLIEQTINSKNLSDTFELPISLISYSGRYFARKGKGAGNHRS